MADLELGPEDLELVWQQDGQQRFLMMVVLTSRGRGKVAQLTNGMGKMAAGLTLRLPGKSEAKK